MLLLRNNQLNRRVSETLKAALSVLVVLIFMIALVFVAAEAHHECSGEECPICACIEDCVRLIRGFGDLLPVITAVATALSVAYLCSLAVSEELVFSTPILSKVRMND